MSIGAICLAMTWFGIPVPVMPSPETCPRLSHSLNGPPVGVPLVFVNGLGGVQAAFAHQVRYFGATRQVLTYDHRGAGGSEMVDAPVTMRDFASDLVGLMDELGISQADLVGLSFGGRVVQELALGWPDRVRKAVLCGTSAGGKLHEAGDARAHELLRTLATSDARVWAETVAPVLFGERYRSRHPDRIQALARWRARHRPDQVGIRRQWEAWDGFDLVDQLIEIRVPILVIHGVEDGLSPVSNAEKLADTIPGACLRLLDGVGHSPNVEDPDRFNQLIEEFLG